MPATAAPSPDRPARARTRALLGVVVLAGAVLTLHVHLTVTRPDRARLSFDSAEYALAGRHLLRTGVLATPFAHPALLERLGTPPFPLVTGHPLSPLLDAAAFAAGGPRAEATLVPPALAYLGLVVLAALVALRLTGSMIAGAAAGAGVAVSGDLLRYATDGMSELPFTLAWTGALLLCVDGRARQYPALVGVLLGVAHLARPVVAPLLPVWLAGMAWSAPPGARLRVVARALVGFLPFAGALVAYKWATTGSPFTESAPYLLLTGMEPGFTVGALNCSFPAPDVAGYLAAHPGALAGKLVANAPRLLAAAFTRESLLLGVLMVSFLATVERERRAFAWMVVALMVGLATMASLTVPSPRHLVPFAPVLWGIGIAEAYRLARPQWPRLAVAALCVAVVVVGGLWPTARSWRHVERAAVTEAEWRALGVRLVEVLPPGTVASDVAPWVSWYADRSSTLLPTRIEMLPALAAHLPLAALVVSNEWVVHQADGADWLAVLEGRRVPDGWTTAAVVTAGRLRARVLVPDRTAH
jgi:hypothetical protein